MAEGKTKGAGGKTAKSWWATQWLRALIQWVSQERLARGRAYARMGQVLSVDVRVGLILAQVQGTRREPYDVRIELHTFSEQEWERVVDTLARQAIYSAQLLNGEMPHHIEQVFQSVGVSLFPSASDDLITHCTCSDPAKPCKHIASVYYQVGQLLDRDPFLLFTMRGRTRRRIMADLRLRRAERLADTAEAAVPVDQAAESGHDLTSDPDDFWRIGQEARDVQVRVQEPEVEMELLKRLGPPAFAESQDLEDELAKLYRMVTAKAIEVAFSDHSADSIDSGQESETDS